MPTLLPTARHLAGLGEAVAAFATYAGRVALDEPVPTCPDWTVLDLVAHQGMVHRWAAAVVRGERPEDGAVAGFRRAGETAADPIAWLVKGADVLGAAIRAAPEDLSAWVFLNDAPPPRAFWARRQCHETTMHAVDALAATLGRAPDPDEVWVDRELAADGIDELLAGFLTRPRAPLRCAEDSLLVVRPDDVDDWWELRLGPRPAVTTRRTTGEQPSAEPDWELTGSAVELYLRVWNRTRPPEEWRHLTAVRWS